MASDRLSEEEIATLRAVHRPITVARLLAERGDTTLRERIEGKALEFDRAARAARADGYDEAGDRYETFAAILRALLVEPPGERGTDGQAHNHDDCLARGEPFCGQGVAPPAVGVLTPEERAWVEHAREIATRQWSIAETLHGHGPTYTKMLAIIDKLAPAPTT